MSGVRQRHTDDRSYSIAMMWTLVACVLGLAEARCVYALTATHTHTPPPACTLTPCPTGEVFHCPDDCPGGCGLICATPTPTVMATPSRTPTSIVNEPPRINSVLTSPTDRCTQTLLGFGRALFCDRRGGVYVVDGEEVESGLQCMTGQFAVSVRLQTNRVNRFSVCQTGGSTGGVGGCVPVEIEQIFVGDCDDDANVTVDEVVRMISIALGINLPSTCALGDGNANEEVTVDEIITATMNALVGCQAGSRHVDLVPLSAREICRNGCEPYVIELCIANTGDEPAFSFDVMINGHRAGVLEGLGANDDTCVEVPYRFPLSPDEPAFVVVDGDNNVLENDDGNNFLQFPQPNPTGCDLICTPTPEPARGGQITSS